MTGGLREERREGDLARVNPAEEPFLDLEGYRANFDARGRRSWGIGIVVRVGEAAFLGRWCYYGRREREALAIGVLSEVALLDCSSKCPRWRETSVAGRKKADRG